MGKTYNSVSEMLHGLADDENSKKFADDFDDYHAKWYNKLKTWWFVKITVWRSKYRQWRYPSSKVPLGSYCYHYENNMRVMCPYWSKKLDKPVRRDGYCKLLNLGDWEVGTESFDSLLWDRVKSCNINKKSDEDIKKRLVQITPPNETMIELLKYSNPHPEIIAEKERPW